MTDKRGTNNPGGRGAENNIASKANVHRCLLASEASFSGAAGAARLSLFFLIWGVTGRKDQRPSIPGHISGHHCAVLH
jgi:hypothetical protein